MDARKLRDGGDVYGKGMSTELPVARRVDETKALAPSLGIGALGERVSSQPADSK